MNRAAPVHSSARQQLHAPAVRVTLRKPPILALALTLLVAAGATAVLGWLLMGASSQLVFKALLGSGLWLLAVLSVVRWWQALPVGALVWDGAQWALHENSNRELQLSKPESLLDLQTHLLLTTRTFDGGRTLWFWLEREQMPGHWNALRRAVFSHVRADRVLPAETLVSGHQPSAGKA